MPTDSQTLPLPLDNPNQTDVDDACFWIETVGFAELAGIHRNNAREAIKRCHTGGTWHKTALIVRQVASVGGKSGQAYQVYAPSLPIDLATAWKAQNPDLFKTTEVPKTFQPVSTQKLIHESSPARLAAIEKGRFLEALIQPALLLPRYSRSRAEAIRQICATQMPVTFPNGKTWTYDERGIYGLVKKHEQGGLPALIRGPRTEAPERVIVSRRFDKIAPFSEAEKRAIWADTRQHIKSLIVGTLGPLRQIERLANSRLVDLCRAKGWAGASLENCEIGIAQVRKFAACRIAAAKSLDAKKFADHFKPRVMRGRKGLRPMEIVMGDVHPVDILNNRVDESQATARMVSWLDLATDRVFYTLFLLEKGKGITQAHIAQSFVQMVRAWGVPSILYLDNGSEYMWKEMMGGFERLALMVGVFEAHILNSEEMEQRIQQADDEDADSDETPSAITRSIPHNPPGKAPAEGLFGVLERTVLCFIPGWIGGDRMNKKTHKMGQSPRSFKGDFAQFEESFATAIAYYHARPRNGGSCNEKFDRHVKSGWTGVDVDYGVLVMALAERKQYKVMNTGIEIAGVTYWHDVMASPYVMGGKMVVYYAKWDTEQIVLLPRDPATGKLADPVVAYVNREFGIVEKSGAIESGRRISLMNKGIREMKKGSSPVDAVAEMRRYTQLCPPATVVPFGPKITIPEECKGIQEAIEQAGEPPKVEQLRLLDGQWYDHDTGKVCSIYNSTTEREEDTVDNWEAEERARLIKKGQERSALDDAEKTIPSGDRLTGQR